MYCLATGIDSVASFYTDASAGMKHITLKVDGSYAWVDSNDIQYTQSWGNYIKEHSADAIEHFK